jgi:CBS domain-containing protein
MSVSDTIERVVATVDENATVLDAAILMAKKEIGSVVVTRNSAISGLFTERDLMKRVVAEKRDPATVKIKDVMPTDLLKITSDETAERCLELMQEHQCRHLVAFDNDEFVGIISLRDLVSLMIKQKEKLIAELKGYIAS